jgi:hypothetical protein
MTTDLRWPITGVLLAIAITSMLDATGFFMFSALPLLPLMALFWYLQRLPRASVGFTWGNARHYAIAILYPVVVIGAVALISVGCGAADFSKFRLAHVALKIARVALATTIVATLTEEGFFRGWLWASLDRAGVKPWAVLLSCAAAFSLWHWSAVTLKTGLGFELPPAQIPLFLANAAVMGLGWGLLRWISGSVVVASVSHGVWNGLAYVLFAWGSKAGALGVKNTAIFGPEVGVVGLAANALFVAGLALWWRARTTTHPVIARSGSDEAI